MIINYLDKFFFTCLTVLACSSSLYLNYLKNVKISEITVNEYYLNVKNTNSKNITLEKISFFYLKIYVN